MCFSASAGSDPSGSTSWPPTPEMSLRWCVMAVLREEGGDRQGAERLARQAADAGDPSAIETLATMRKTDKPLQLMISLGIEADGTTSVSE